MKKTVWDCLNGYLRCLSVLTLSEGGEDLVLWEGGLFQGAQRVISPPPPAGRGASAHCPAGVVNLRQNGERNGMWHCRVSIQYPTGPNRQAATKPPTHPRSKGSGSTPDLGHSGLGCRGQWRRCLAGVTKVSVKQSAVNCVIHWCHWLFITSTINTTVCCWSNLTADAYTRVLPDSFFLLPVHDCHLNNGVYEHVLALRKLMLIYPDGLCVKKTKPWQFPRLRSTNGAFVARPPIAALYLHFLSLGCCLLSSPHS